VWTVDRDFEQPVRHMNLNMSGGSFVANLTLRLAPDLDNAGVRFTSAVADPDAAYYAPYVEEGVRAFVSRRAVEGRAVGHLRVTLTAITIHPVDAKAHRFAQAAEMAMSQAFEAAAVEL
jgi:translation elongation factor EF-G